MAGFLSLEEHMQAYTSFFLRLQEEEEREPAFWKEEYGRLEQEEQASDIFLPAVYLRMRYDLSRLEYWIVLFAFCQELEEGLCLHYRSRYGDGCPSLQYALHLFSPILPVDFNAVARLGGQGEALWDILERQPETEWNGVQCGFLQGSLRLTRTAFFFLLTQKIPQEEWYRLWNKEEEEAALLPVHEREYRQLCGYLQAEKTLRIRLSGAQGSGRHTLLCRACGALDRSILFIDEERILQKPHALRQQSLQSLCLIAALEAPVMVMELAGDRADLQEAGEEEVYRRSFAGALQGFCSICFLSKPGQAGKVDADVMICLQDVLSREEKTMALDMWIAPKWREDWQDALLSRYRLYIGELKGKLWQMTLRAQAEGISLREQSLWTETLQEAREDTRLGRLVEGKYAPEDMILQAECKKQLDTVIRLAKVWQGGLQVLFHGSSGTGKTMAASVLAHALGMPLFQVDISQVFDKYIGETEKHVDEIFRTARRGQYLLFFDEADALFARRTAVKDSHDRYANVSAAYLLQRMEEYDGILILATNLKDNFDDAFVRRIRFVIKFRNPDTEGRKRLWEKALKGEPPAGQDTDFGALAQAAELSPARICAAAQAARLLAVCDASEVITWKHLQEALLLEAGKDETMVRL